jgi:predicted negative regulator of RcsB-dependent stress response
MTEINNLEKGQRILQEFIFLLTILVCAYELVVVAVLTLFIWYYWFSRKKNNNSNNNNNSRFVKKISYKVLPFSQEELIKIKDKSDNTRQVPLEQEVPEAPTFKLISDSPYSSPRTIVPK